MRLASALQIENLTSAQIAALATGTGRYPKGSVLFDTTLNYLVVNEGTDSAQIWVPASGLVAFNPQVASYQLVMSDIGKLVQLGSAGAMNLTVPPNSTVAFPIGTVIYIIQTGAGQVTVVQGAGVSVFSAGGALKIAAQFGMAQLIKNGTDTWYLAGNITP